MRQQSLVLLPGLDGTGIMFRPIINELKQDVEPIVISYKQEAKCSYHILADQVANSLPNNDFFILGESFSGPIALMIADRKPKDLKGIILCATFIDNPSAYFPSFLSFLIVAPLFYVWPVSIKANVLTGGRADDRIKELMRETRKETRNDALAARTRATMKVNVSEELRRCTYPILYLRGARDIVVTSRNFRRIKKIKSDISDVTFDTAHLVLQEAPEKAAKEIINFIKQPHNKAL